MLVSIGGGLGGDSPGKGCLDFIKNHALVMTLGQILFVFAGKTGALG